MKKSYKKLSRETGLEIGSILGNYFLKLDHLHYGYWDNDLKVDITNLRQAQENYTDFLLSQIPKGVKTILDVGCGTGSTARKLVDNGYHVDCLSPSHFQCERVKLLLRKDSCVYECEYEKIETQKRYDLILFSESFQYINPSEGLAKSLEILNKKGFILICDIFRKTAGKTGAIKGGHELEKFYKIASDYSLELIKDVDITDATAPNMDLLSDVTANVAQPIVQLTYNYLNARYSLASKILRWWYGKQIDKKYQKYFNGGRTGQDFKNSRTYRLLLYRTGDII